MGNAYRNYKHLKIVVYLFYSLKKFTKVFATVR